MMDAVRQLMAQMEADMFYGVETPQEKLRRFLSKLSIKSASASYGKALKMESLHATLKQVTFEADKLKLWKQQK